jgi:hypothetical protein
MPRAKRRALSQAIVSKWISSVFWDECWTNTAGQLPLNCGNWPINGIKPDWGANPSLCSRAALTNRARLR